MRVSEKVEWNRAMLERWCIQPYREIAEAAARRVFVGEWGCWNRTPHAGDFELDARLPVALENRQLGLGVVVLSRLLRDLDSNRSDVAYENWHGHKLDRRMLELLRES